MSSVKKNTHNKTKGEMKHSQVRLRYWYKQAKRDEGPGDSLLGLDGGTPEFNDYFGNNVSKD